MVWAALVVLVVALAAGLLAAFRKAKCGGRAGRSRPASLREGLIVGAAAAAVLGGLTLALMRLRPEPECRNRWLAEAAARGRTAVLFERDCGATTGFSTHIALVRTGDPLPQAGDVFIADGGHGRAPAAIRGGPWADMLWERGDLMVRYDPRARVFLTAGNVDGTRIRFEAAPVAEIDALLRQGRNR